ncbi:RDD family protein [Mycobacterium sp.]|uniref:RDD family protein n=1 Tax=Mycobacterium sp. TaxID=1785 RepID=UPI0012755168|nr:RDD family protein [Mycobacterium sp.]KAA8969303.1 MAG: RDD family protein [Mycobacterium sp.]
MSPGPGSWLSGAGQSAPDGRYPGAMLGMPEHGSGSLAPTGRRLAALLVDWLVAYGLAGLGLTLGLVTPARLSTAVLVTWWALGLIAVWLFGFTPGQFALGLRVVSTGPRPRIGLGRAAVRGLLIALVVPALFTDTDGRGLQDRVTATAVVRR